METVNWYEDKEYVTEYQQKFNCLTDLNSKIEMVEYYRMHLYCKNPNKWRYFAVLINAIAKDADIHALYEIDMEAHYWDDRIKRKNKRLLPQTVNLRPLASYDIPLPVCYDTSGQDYDGLYFVGATYFVPTTMQPIYAVKIGVSYTDIGKRIRDYGTANPFIYHENSHVLPFCVCPDADEQLCHNFLSSIAIQTLDKDTEWYIVDRDTYFYLCENLKNIHFFKGVATGKIRAI